MFMAFLSATAQHDPELKPIFDGHSLAGWETPDFSYWTIEDGAITGRITKEHPCTINQYLVWKGGELADFELKLKSRLNGEGAINNGFQFRSRLLPDHDVCGYQMDNNLQTPWLVRLYDEYGRHTLALRGERTIFDSAGQRNTSTIAEANGSAWFRLEDWHEYHLTCVGSKITLRVDGKLAADVEDLDRRRQELQGILALQLHSGPATIVQFKDIRLKILNAADQKTPPTLSDLEKRRIQLLQRSAAWWPLDTGGHGANPPLRHIPGWEKFELNVKADGSGARPGSKVVLLEGAHFEAGPIDLNEKAFTLFLRARDPRGRWQGTLFSKGKRPDSLIFALRGEYTPANSQTTLVFEIQTTEGLATLPIPTSLFKDAWHDFVARYDGHELAIFSDGAPLTRKSHQGTLLKIDSPLLIGAELHNNQATHHFHGELEEAAIWPAALSNDEVRLLSGHSP